MGMVLQELRSKTIPFRVPHVQTAPCRVVIDAAVEAWIAKLQRVVMTQLHQARRKWKSNPQTNVFYQLYDGPSGI